MPQHLSGAHFHFSLVIKQALSITACANFSQPSNAVPAISVTLAGITIEAKPVQPWKAYS